jgi:hypothetical protein
VIVSNRKIAEIAHALFVAPRDATASTPIVYAYQLLNTQSGAPSDQPGTSQETRVPHNGHPE